MAKCIQYNFVALSYFFLIGGWISSDTRVFSTNNLYFRRFIFYFIKEILNKFSLDWGLGLMVFATHWKKTNQHQFTNTYAISAHLH
jgi:hypothetical protein